MWAAIGQKLRLKLGRELLLHLVCKLNACSSAVNNTTVNINYVNAINTLAMNI